jgi:hypothetical protein
MTDRHHFFHFSSDCFACALPTERENTLKKNDDERDHPTLPDHKITGSQDNTLTISQDVCIIIPFSGTLLGHNQKNDPLKTGSGRDVSSHFFLFSR